MPASYTLPSFLVPCSKNITAAGSDAPFPQQTGLHPLTRCHNPSFTKTIIYFFLGRIFQTLLTQSVLSIHLLRGLSSVPFPEAPSYNFFTLPSLFTCLLRPAHRPALPNLRQRLHIHSNQEHLHIYITFNI